MSQLMIRLLALAAVFLSTQSAAIIAADIPAATTQLVSAPELNERLGELIKEHKVPGMVAGIVKGSDLVAVGVAGVRKSGAADLMTIHDQMHLGSCTKAMTATRIAMLVEAGKLQWDSTLASVFPEEIKEAHPDFHSVTLTQLLNHRAGLPANIAWDSLGKDLSITEKRRSLISHHLKQAPKPAPGTKFVYSNLGYALAGAMAETVSGQSWEELMRAGLFAPLGMTTAGFGAPGSSDNVDQPWGHSALLGFLTPSKEDNPPALGPAGTVHASLPDWAKFAALHLQAANGKPKLLTADAFSHLQTPPENANYAMGWIIASPEWAKGKVLAHDGSNTMWYSSIWIHPERDLAIMVCANRADPAAVKACHEAVRSLFEYADKLDATPKAEQ